VEKCDKCAAVCNPVKNREYYGLADEEILMGSQRKFLSW